MKLTKHNRKRSISVFAPVFLAGLALFATTGCGGSSSWNPFDRGEPEWKSSHRVLETRVDGLKGQIEQDKAQSERADFWRIVAIALIAVAFFALVGGTALGSRARRDSHLFGDDDDLTQPLAEES